MAKAIIKINKSNGQKFVNIGKDTPFKDGEEVTVIKFEKPQKKTLDLFSTENKEDLDSLLVKLKKINEEFELSYEYKMAEWFGKEYNVKSEWGYDISLTINCNDTWADYSGFFGSCLAVEDCDNFIKFNEDIECKNIDLALTEDEHGLYLDLEKINKKHIQNTMNINTYTDLMDSAYDLGNHQRNEILNKFDFYEVKDPYYHNIDTRSDEEYDYELYKHKDEEIYLSFCGGFSYDFKFKLFVDNKDVEEKLFD